MTKICIPQRIIPCKTNGIQQKYTKVVKLYTNQTFNYYRLKIHNKFHNLARVCFSNVEYVYHTDLGIFWLKIAKNGVYCFYRYCSKLFDKIRRETEFRQWCCWNCKKKYNVSEERENWISVLRLPKFLSCPHSPKWKPIVAMALPKNERKKKKKKNYGN